ncbi:MAG: hypothetical protein ACK52M_15625 [bacterium]
MGFGAMLDQMKTVLAGLVVDVRRLRSSLDDLHRPRTVHRRPDAGMRVCIRRAGKVR